MMMSLVFDQRKEGEPDRGSYCRYVMDGFLSSGSLKRNSYVNHLQGEFELWTGTLN